MDELAEAKRLVRDLDDLNSKFPETQKFLRARGLSHVTQLDQIGREELMCHLVAVRDKLYN